MSAENTYVRKAKDQINAAIWDGTAVGIRPIAKRLEASVRLEFARWVKDLDENGDPTGTFSGGDLVAVWLHPKRFNKVRLTLTECALVREGGKLRTMTTADLAALYDAQ